MRCYCASLISPRLIIRRKKRLIVADINSCNTAIADTVRMMASAELRGKSPRGEQEPTLVVDATGVGAPVVDLFKRERMSATF
jgi:hypothetical protein